MFEAHAHALVKFLKTAHVPQEISSDQFGSYVASLTTDNGVGFSDVDLNPEGRNHNKALYVSIECRGTTLAHVSVDTGSSLNVLLKGALDKLDCKGVVLKPSDIELLRTRLLFIGQVEPTKLQEGIYL